jgi:hypothetical protein
MKNLRSTSRRPELLLDLIALDRKSHEPLHRQLYLRLVELIIDGSLPLNGIAHRGEIARIDEGRCGRN